MMRLILFVIPAMVLSFHLNAQVHYPQKYSNSLERKKPKFQYIKNNQIYSSGVEHDNHLVQAVKLQRNVSYLEAGNLVVMKLLPDDTSGREHQKFVIRLSSGKLVSIISNLDFCDRVPVSVGDIVAVGGEFIWTKNGGLVHWVHSDPKGQRPNGYITFNGQSYCR